MNSSPVDRIQAEFRHAAEKLFLDSPFYRNLCGPISHDSFLLEMAAAAQTGQSGVLMLFGAVHYLILAGSPHPLAGLYAALEQGDKLLQDPWPLFRDFCERYSTEIRPIIANRRVQTNEIGRSVFLRLGLDWIGKISDWTGISWMEVGASAGLNLVWDRFEMQFRHGDQVLERGDSSSGVRLKCVLTGNPTPAAMGYVTPSIFNRLGVDIDPMDTARKSDRNWVLAFVWADQPARLQRLRNAMNLLQQSEITVTRADATTAIAELSDRFASDTPLCVAHTFLTSQLTPEANANLLEQLSLTSRRHTLARLGVEWLDNRTRLLAELWENGRPRQRVHLANGHPHGQDAEWVERFISPEPQEWGRIAF